MHKIFFLNSLSRSLEEFIPLSNSQITLYTCGPTVYDAAHIGHARSCIVWDILVRFLRAVNYQVLWARNITDIDDKIIKRSQELQISPEKLARSETYNFWRDMQNLNVSWPDYEPKATENLPQMFDFIQGLLNNKSAYQASNGDIYFEVGRFKAYGQLKNLQDCKDNISRIDHQTCKEQTDDFALWKAFDKNKGEYGFGSPFGYGRPGWHLECSSMIKTLFGETIDIHGGGEDLIFPHHENEIAQSEALHSQKFAQYWLHNGMVMVEGRKMSKSLGNFITIKQSLQSYSGNAIRFFVLNAHYRQPINYTEQALEAAENGFKKLAHVLAEETFEGELKPEIMSEFYTALSQDLNTPCALALAFETAKSINKGQKELLPTLKQMLEILGFNLAEAKQSKNQKQNLKPLFDLLLEMREKARQSKDFALADKIRIQFETAGYKLKDLPTGTELILD